MTKGNIRENSLRCWNCIYNDNCEEVNDNCVANKILDDKVVHLKQCETKNYKERYKKIGESEWFKKHYENKSIGDIIDILDDVANNQMQ